MKRKLTTKYMVVFSISVLMVVLIWLGLVYYFLFSGDAANESNPQYLVRVFHKYVSIGESTYIKEEGKVLLAKNNLWTQIIDDNGEVVAEYNVPDGVEKKYNLLQICDYVMNYDQKNMQTLFFGQFDIDSNYGVIIGCDTSRINKINLNYTGDMKKVAMNIMLILIIVFFSIGILAGIYFSRNISKPIYEIIDDINKLEAKNNTEEISNDNKIFKSVFESLEKLRQRLIAADVARKHTENQRNEWISNVSHDMKTPLTSIMGYAEIMTYENIVLSEKDKAIYCRKIYKHANSINELIEELKFSRLLENGQINLEKEEVDVCELLEECIDEVPSNYDADRITYEFSDDEIWADIDRHLIKRCFVNIICNAVVHNNADVDIIIRCRQHDNITVEIEDNGKGMTEKDMQNIFTRYYRGKKSKNVAGSGLGLAIANDIVKVHGGTINVESEPEKGTKFIIVI